MLDQLMSRFSRQALPILAILALSFATSANAVDIFATGGTYIYKFDSDTGARTVLLNQSGASYRGVATAPNGNVYAADYTNSTVVGLTSTGGSISGYTQISNPSWSNYGVAYNPLNATLAVNSLTTTAKANIYNMTGGTATGTTSYNLPTFTTGLSYDVNGNLYSASNFSDAVLKNGSSFISLTSGAAPEAVFVDQIASRLYITADNGKVYRTDLNGTMDTAFGSSGSMSVSQPSGVAVAGNYLFVTSGASINKYDLTGTLVTSGWGSTVSGNFAFMTAYNAVPEPSTYALAAIATGVLGFAARRRKV